MTLHRMAANASSTLIEPHVTDETPTTTQIWERVCSGCGSRFRPKRPWQKQCSARCRQRSVCSPSADEDRFLLRGVNGPLERVDLEDWKNRDR